MEAKYFIRPIEWTEGVGVSDAEYALFCSWWRAHGVFLVPREFLPRLGVVVQEERGGKRHDVAAVWLDMSNSIGVAYIEKIITKPKLPLNRARMAIERGVDYLQKAARELGYHSILLRTPKAIARFAKKLGFVGNEELVGMCCILKGEA